MKEVQISGAAILEFLKAHDNNPLVSLYHLKLISRNLPSQQQSLIPNKVIFRYFINETVDIYSVHGTSH